MASSTTTSPMDQLERKKGSIVRIKLINFMTFVKCEFKPGPRLNVILGPNGSGKSSLICAIGLGLGGSPKILGRSAHTKEYVRKGAEGDAIIEIELYDKEGNIVVERSLSQDKNESTWRINGKREPEKKVQEVLRQMEIQVDNLVQFLPQDKVAEFSQFNEFQLLRETIRAVLGTDHLTMQDEIAKSQEEVNSNETRVEKKKAEFEELKIEVERDAQLVERQRGREKLLAEIKMLKMKLPWIKFEEVRDQAFDEKKRLKEMEEEAAHGSQLLEPLKQSQKDIAKLWEKSKKEYEKAASDHKQWATKIDNHHSALNESFDELDTVREEISESGKMKEKSVQAAKAQQEKVKKMEGELEQCQKGDEYYDARLAELKRQIDPLAKQEATLKVEHSRLSAEQSRKSAALSQLKRKEQQAEERLGGNPQQTAARINQIEKENKELIDKLRIPAAEKPKLLKLRMDSKKSESKLIGPLICELRSDNEQASNALEYSLRPGTWKMFVCTDPRDQEKLMETRTSCMLIMNSPQPASSVPRALKRDNFAELGILGYLDELLKCDPLAIEAARKTNSIHQVLVGSETTERLYKSNPAKFQSLMQQTPDQFRDKLTLITPHSRFEFSKSKYDSRNGTTMKVTGLDPSKALNLPLDRSSHEEAERERKRQEFQANRSKFVAEKQTLESEVAQTETQLSELSAELHEVEKKCQELRDLRQKETKAKDHEHRLESALEPQRAKLVQLEKAAAQDFDAKLERLKNKERKLCQDIFDQCTNLTAKAAECDVFSKRLLELTLSKNQFEIEKQVLSQALAEEEQRMKAKHQELESQKLKVTKLLEQARALKLLADETCEVTEEILQEFEKLPDSSEDIQSAIDAKTYTVERIFEDSTVLTEYEKRVKQMNEISQFLELHGKQLEHKQNLLNVQIENWLTPVKSMAVEINEKVMRFFREINKAGYQCAGEVSLQQQNAKNVNTFGMVIQVKFRQEQKMGRLDQSVQSGGERSLTTFLYMLALQELSAVPFRVVDEINQGMDADKERLAFYRLADVSASSKNTSQYFMATPKLLPGLKFPKNATILFVFNGRYNLEQEEWDLSKFLQVRSQKRLSSSSSSSGSINNSGTANKRMLMAH